MYIKEQKDQYQRLEARFQRQEADFDLIRREFNGVRLENAQLRAEISGLQNSMGMTHHVSGSNPAQVNGYPVPAPPEQPQQQLPPLRNISGPEAMNGVQYQHEPRGDGYRSGPARF